MVFSVFSGLLVRRIVLKDPRPRCVDACMSLRSEFRDTSNLRWLRSLTELGSSFVIAVLLLRGLILEGYMVSTGSMAPGLLGFHKQVCCPECDYLFAFGVSFDDSVGSETLAAAHADVSDTYATCPNCGKVNINVGAVPRNHGDQLLVHKHVFDLRRPRRWERVVFRNPSSPGESYVKRVVGLPGETIRIVDGDLYVGGLIARKSYEIQSDMKIPVFDMSHLPTADDWELPWRMTGVWEFANGGSSGENGPLKDLNGPVDRSEVSQSGAAAENWLEFHNWRWFGGEHIAEVPLPAVHALADWNQFLERFDRIPVSWAARIEYDRDAQVLRCRGVMPPRMQQDLVNHATSPVFQNAVYRLAALSHVTPATDRYGYNAMVSSPEFSVSDLFLQTKLSWTTAPETIRVKVPVRNNVFELYLDLGAGVAILVDDSSRKVVRRGPFLAPVLSSEPGRGALTVEASNFDQRVLVAINGELAFEPYDVPATVEQALAFQDSVAAVERPGGGELHSDREQHRREIAAQQSRLALGAVGGDVRIDDLKLSRDVYYTPGRRKHAVDTDFAVPADCYFVHGDNSPVSFDSRSWDEPCVPHRLLVGKPFVVHLPSQPGRLSIGGRELSIRIPDFGRMRYIR